MRMHSVVLVLACALARESSAQSTAQKSVVGVWRGTSTCLVRPSACNDESVVYRITPTKTADSLTIDARKIIGGEEQGMGLLSCRLMSQSGQLACAIPHGVWQFGVHGDTLTGELRLRDHTLFRDVRAVRAS